MKALEEYYNAAITATCAPGTVIDEDDDVRHQLLATLAEVYQQTKEANSAAFDPSRCEKVSTINT